jgi:hypothetical protein
METGDEGAAAKRAAEVRASLQFLSHTLQLASVGYTPEPPEQARTAVRIALAGVIKLISDLFPDEPSFPAPLIQLRLDLDDLESGKVSKLFKAKKVDHRPPTALSEDLFRAIAAAAMTRLMEGRRLKLEEAARDVARRLSRIGAKDASGKAITYRRIAKWREEMMTELASENLAVARYEHTLRMLGEMEPSEAVELMLDKLMRNETRHLIITIPPRHLKSICTSVALPAYILGHDPTKRIICVSYSQELAVKHANDCRIVMNSDWYRRAFPRTRIDPSKNTETEFMTTERGFRLSTSVGGTLTGRGGDLIIIDDPIKPADAMSDTTRQRLIDWYGTTLLSRLDDKEKGAAHGAKCGGLML